VGHGLKRLVVIGSDGMISLAALRWLADQDAAFFMLDRQGKVLAVTGPVSPSDARLRRAQALAGQNGMALEIARQLISAKLSGQETVARESLENLATADAIARLRERLSVADRLDLVRSVEAQAAAAYWSAWSALPVIFPRQDMKRVPEHWRTFGTRKSQLTGSPRLAVTPPGAILNYCYALLESESRLAAAALGLDPGIGMLHADTPNRDSLACDLMEPIRPSVDAFVLDWITREPLKREWSFEQRDGNCRLMGSFAAKLSETAPTWGRAVAPFAEWVARALWSSPARKRAPLATRLTQQHRREAGGEVFALPENRPPRPPRVCSICGATLKRGRRYCASCVNDQRTERMIAVGRRGRLLSNSPEAQASRAITQRRHQLARRSWKSSSQPPWLTEQTYREKIQPDLVGIKSSAIASALGVSFQYAIAIRRGARCPHPRHWRALAGLVGYQGADRSRG